MSPLQSHLIYAITRYTKKHPPDRAGPKGRAGAGPTGVQQVQTAPTGVQQVQPAAGLDPGPVFLGLGWTPGGPTGPDLDPSGLYIDGVVLRFVAQKPSEKKNRFVILNCKRH